MLIERKPIPGYEDHYEITNDGRVFRIKAANNTWIGRELKPHIDSHGYRQVGLCADGKFKQLLVHRLVAITFIPNPDNLPEINHRDGNKAYNNVNNLEWCDRNHNIRHARDVLGNPGGIPPRRVIGTHLASGIMIWMPSTAEAARFIKGDQGSVWAICQGRFNQTKGWKFQYAN